MDVAGKPNGLFRRKDLRAEEEPGTWQPSEPGTPGPYWTVPLGAHGHRRAKSQEVECKDQLAN